jgi:hypothetical protein
MFERSCAVETKKKSRLTIVLIATVVVLALALIVVMVMGRASIEEQGIIADPPTEAPTEPPTEPPTDPPPTLPPPEENPYGNMDFQYEGRYLKLRGGRSLTGIDVSHWQNEIDWEQVRDSGVDFAMIRLGYRGYEQGALGMDTYAIANLDGAIAAGEAALRLGKAKLAVRYAMDAHRLQDLREDAVILLVRALRSAGRAYEIPRVYRRFSQHLIETQGIPPSIALRRAVEIALGDGANGAGGTSDKGDISA